MYGAKAATTRIKVIDNFYPLLGNVKVVWTDGQNVSIANREGQQMEINDNVKEEEPDLPF